MYRILSTVNGPWSEPVTTVTRKSQRQFLRDVWRLSHAHDVIIVLGSFGFQDRYIDLLAVMMLKLRRDPPAIVITDATWEMGSATLSAGSRWRRHLVPVLARTAIRALDGPNITYCVLSSEEEAEFPGRWGVDPHRVVFTPFYWTLRSHASAETERGPHVFSGGDSLRDYGLLVDAVRTSDVEVRIASSWQADGLPKNLRVEWMSHDDYMRCMLRSNLVVVPLQRRPRSAGQQTYLNAMAAGKAVIVTEAPGVRDYVEDGRTGVVVLPDPAQLRAAIERLTASENAGMVEEMARQARSVARSEFSEEQYCRRVAEVAHKSVRRWAEHRRHG
jgi:hypothetical protein